MASVIVVDTELKDSIKEYAQIIDAVNGNTEFSGSVVSDLGDGDAEIEHKSELITKITQVSTSSTLTKLSDREFEPAFYLLIHILSELSEKSSAELLDDENSYVIKLLLESNPEKQALVRDRKTVKSTSILSILTNIFNLIPEVSKTRIYLIKQILNIVKSSNIKFSIIENNLGNNLINWLTKSQANDTEIRSIFWDFIQLDSEFSLKSLTLIKSFTLNYELQSIQELYNLINFALSSKTVDVSFLITNNVAQSLQAHAQDSLVATFTKYVQGDLVTVPESFSNFKFINQKSRILSLAKFLSEKSQSNDHDSIIFKYDEIPTELAANSYEFETLLVNSIRANVIEGKLNQLESTFYLSRVNRFILAGGNNHQVNANNWNEVKQALYEWKNSLANINEIVKATRENIFNNGSA
ncbi:hypothetical protein DFJ63DRAFT_310457 [Scheffersomyces coipomensis]|uniref:uncharacterized protein n=1 Tax=Scheffersomyces coipomensis TaxID=1788519 RepID=UPI00315D86BF